MKCNTNRTNRDQFDRVADIYDKVRPSYPTAIIDRIIDYSKINKQSKLFEIGMGTGQATRIFLDKGYHVYGIEPGVDLSRIAQANLEQYEHLGMSTEYFEGFKTDKTYDLIFSATAFHWLDPEVAYSKSAQLLNSGGVLAPFWTMMPTVDSDVEQMLRDIFQKHSPDLIVSTFGCPTDIALAEGEKEFSNTGFFNDVQFFRHEWTEDYTAREYTMLLDTYANFQALDGDVKDRVYTEIECEVNKRFGGKVTNHYLTVVHLGRRV